MHRTLEVIGACDLRPCTQRGPEINGDAGDERNGRRAGKGHHDGARNAPRPLGQRVLEDGYG